MVVLIRLFLDEEIVGIHEKASALQLTTLEIDKFPLIFRMKSQTTVVHDFQ